MRITQLSFLFLFFLTFGLVLSRPVSKAISKRDDSVATILDTLNNTIDPILDQISSVISSNSANDTSIALLIHDLDTALYNASSAIRALGYVNETAEDIVRMAAPIINDIVKVVDPLRTQVSRAMLRKVDAALAHFMNSLEGHVAGLLDLVSARITDVVSLLRQLSFGQILSALGL